MRTSTRFAGTKKFTCNVRIAFVCSLLSLAFSMNGQTSPATAAISAAASAQIPRLIRFSGVAKDDTGKGIKSLTGITFSLYKDETGGAPLWMETQNVQIDSGGHYTALLGSNTSEGVPAELFSSGEAQWLGVQVQGHAEQPRVLMVSVPYALKALDAETVGGKPASAFMLAPTAAAANSTANRALNASTVSGDPARHPILQPLGGNGTTNYITRWTSSSNLGNSILYQNTAGNRVGISTTTPGYTLDVQGGGIINSKTSYYLGNQAFGFGSYANQNAFLGFAGNSTMSGTNNTATGKQALFSNTSGSYNTATGVEALVLNTKGSYNTANGMDALYANTTGRGNTATGEAALEANTTGIFNTANGLDALFYNTTGSLNTASGDEALLNNTTGSYNTAVGYNAGPDSASANLSNSTAIGANAVVSASNALVLGGTGGNAVNVGIGTAKPGFTLDVEGTGVANVATSFNLGGQPFAFGSYANQNAFLGFAGNSTMTGQGNSATGYQALAANTTGSTNTADGLQALYSNTSGTGNTADGNGALYTNTTGGFNTANGRGALFNNSTGSYNTALGVDALAGNSTGQDNTACGLALVSNTTGSYNVACGNSALTSNTSGGGNSAFGFEALSAAATGNYNTADGYSALYSNTTGSYNTALGYNAGPDASSTNLTNATALGANAVVSQSNALILGAPGVNVGIGTATPSNVFTVAQGGGQAIADGWTTYSSRRWKTNIQTLHGALAKVEQMRGVSYDRKDTGKHEVGVIAEEVGAVVPEIVSWEKNGKDAKGVDYSRLTALLIEAVKQQERQIVIQSEQIRKLRGKDVILEGKLTLLQSRLEELRQVRKVGSDIPTRVVSAAQPQF